jgi:hypothetical protein
MHEMINAYNILVGRPEDERPIGGNRGKMWGRYFFIFIFILFFPKTNPILHVYIRVKV